jgi:uncharacterized protein (TIGR02301 family)
MKISPVRDIDRSRDICRNRVAFPCLGYSAHGHYALIHPMARTSAVLFVCLCFAAAVPAYGQGFWGQGWGQGRGSWGQGWGDQQPQQRYYRPAPRPVQPQAQPQPQQEAQPQPQNRPAPYDHDLQRLAEILGSLHFLRGICGSNEGQKWRNEAQVLIDTEAPSGERHEQMIASFNRGYRAFQQSYRTCTPAADFAIRRYLAEGAKIAREITARYAN